MNAVLTRRLGVFAVFGVATLAFAFASDRVVVIDVSFLFCTRIIHLVVVVFFVRVGFELLAVAVFGHVLVAAVLVAIVILERHVDQLVEKLFDMRTQLIVQETLLVLDLLGQLFVDVIPK